ncbi:MAG: Exodeoxyribonuclease III [Candidatus Nomurabacteria bacterium GW2011_GWF2_35_12]|uniref:Exodeoxyribonuclease III n=2 Tax=Candidatus Nomuraibacteriota TaxID=1752729 RepID=A0A0G0GD39_9BACT|nr:MAG: Exodeoxyribonuclease III [Candidatus Nomurabacteria bacterium GW2011_GWF2_35_12]KKP75500.1 MAG: Exodeoxyribonuclease III [Parcubacteria group bacterium GW2011_GWC1_35_21]KKP78059.1 MAG: Exodeoxyribonuclease III [Candidatus Nomurabacteria bacterium GW2011_GWC2_35_35]KKP87514.1 MAG: Exodeoxyribonuclease III [Candidatus Nomurabacteria bacterium GW2011_GWA2_35_80]KKP97735.1 MAG: Exodeoxyribonuclease III [Candidatus Nomurabacteria bacterium GW2011_GWA1_36_15]HBH71517.1 exodeoxyribonuclease 
MKIVSWNTNGLRATVKQGFFIPLFQKGKPDILCLQETKAHPEQLTEETRNISGYFSYFSHSKLKKGYSGVAIYSKEKPEEIFYGMGIKKFDDEGRLVGVKLKNFTIITVYFPNGGQGPHRLKYKLEFYDAFLKFILKLRKKGEHIIFCGDVNTAHEAIDLANPKANEENTGFLPIERAWVSKVIKNNFVDIFRKFYPNKIGAYTYWDQKTRARDRNVGWRLDYFFVSSEIMPKIKKTGMFSDYYGSDHCPIWLEIY